MSRLFWCLVLALVAMSACDEEAQRPLDREVGFVFDDAAALPALAVQDVAVEPPLPEQDTPTVAAEPQYGQSYLQELSAMVDASSRTISSPSFFVGQVQHTLIFSGVKGQYEIRVGCCDVSLSFRIANGRLSSVWINTGMSSSYQGSGDEVMSRHWDDVLSLRDTYLSAVHGCISGLKEKAQREKIAKASVFKKPKKGKPNFSHLVIKKSKPKSGMGKLRTKAH